MNKFPYISKLFRPKFIPFITNSFYIIKLRVLIKRKRELFRNLLYYIKSFYFVRKPG